MRRKIIGLFTTSIIFASIIAGCGSSANYSEREYAASESYSDSYVSDDVYMKEASADYSYEESYEESYSENNGGNENVTVKDTSRKIIKTVNLNVETEEFDKLLANVKNKVDAMGGYLESTDVSGKSLYSTGVEKRYANITARVPANKLDEFVNNIAENSNVTNKSESAQDVTLNYTDTKAHIDSLRVEQERLDELLKQATDIETIVVIEDKRTAVRYEIESYESQLRTFDNKIDYSTVYLYVSEVVEYTVNPDEKQPFIQRISSGFGKSFSNVLENTEDAIADFIINIPYLIYTIISFIIGLFVVCIVIIIVLKVFSFAIKVAKGKNGKSELKGNKTNEKNKKEQRSDLKNNKKKINSANIKTGNKNDVADSVKTKDASVKENAVKDSSPMSKGMSIKDELDIDFSSVLDIEPDSLDGVDGESDHKKRPRRRYYNKKNNSK